MPISRLADFNQVVANATSTQEYGVTHSVLFRNFITGETISVIPISYAELKRCTQQDGQARALLQLITGPVRVATWDAYDPEEDDARASKGVAARSHSGSPERQLVEDIFFKPRSEGGMTIPWRRVVASMALAARDGFKAFEKVWEIDQRGRFVLKKLAPRANDTVAILSDANGDFNGFHQRAYFAGKIVNVVIPKEKSLLFVYGGEENQLYGEPVFLPIYYHYDKKQKLYYISHVAFQNLAIPPKVLIMPEGGGSTPESDDLLKKVASIGLNAAIRLPPGYDLKPFESNRALADMLPLITHHNDQMAKAVLGQFIDVTRSGTGQLTAEQSDVFLLALQTIINDIEDTVNNYVIPQLIDFNFKTQSYPRLRARPFTDQQQQAIQDTFDKIMTAGADKNSPEFLIALEEQMAQTLGLDQLDYSKISPEFLKQHEQRLQLNAARMAALNAGGGPGGPGNQGGGGGPQPNNGGGGPQPNAGRKNKVGRSFGKEGNK